MAEPAPRLYLVTPPRLDPAAFAGLLSRALGTVPAACLRIDLGDAPEDDWRRAADHLMPVCHEAEVALVVADHHRLVAPLGLDGVHLARSRVPVAEVRRALGRDAILGAGAGTSRHKGMTMAEAGADYVSFGPVGDTGLLGDEERVADDLFAWWHEVIEVPSVAEGGATPADAARLSAIADFVVPDRRVWDAEDAVERLSAYAAALA